MKISEIIADKYKLRIPPTVYYDLLADVQEAEEPTTKNDLALIHTEGLDEEIRCTMCTDYMKSDRGCDGSCVVDKDMYKAVMDAIEKRIQPTTKNDLGVDREDAVERLNALKQLIGYDKDSEIVKATQKSLDMAIKALDQEPMVEIDLYSVIKQKYIEREVLDKIRAEIEQLTIVEGGDDYVRKMAELFSLKMKVLQIIDKYKAEQE